MSAKKSVNKSLAVQVKDLEQKLKDLSKVEEELRENEEKFRDLFNLSNDSIFIHDPDGTIVDVNQKALELFGYTESEFKAIKIPMLHPKDAFEKSKRAFRTIMEQGVVRFEIDFKKKSGEVFPAEVSSSIFRSGNREFIQGIVRDISRRRQAEKALLDSEAKLRAMLNASPLTIILLDRNGKILDTNTEHAGSLSLPRSRSIGKGYWNMLEAYIYKHSEVKFSHGLCPDCIKKYYPEVHGKLRGPKKPESTD